MKIDNFKGFSFEELLALRKEIGSFQKTKYIAINNYILTERETGDLHTRTSRCITLIDMLIVKMAVSGQLIPKPILTISDVTGSVK